MTLWRLFWQKWASVRLRYARSSFRRSIPLRYFTAEENGLRQIRAEPRPSKRGVVATKTAELAGQQSAQSGDVRHGRAVDQRGGHPLGGRELRWILVLRQPEKFIPPKCLTEPMMVIAVGLPNTSSPRLTLLPIAHRDEARVHQGPQARAGELMEMW